MLKQLIICTVVIISLSVVQGENLNVTVFYEVLCGDSRRFVTKQLYPAYNDLGNYFNIDLVPYGKASSHYINGAWSFECQHGPNECYGNQYHACAIHKYSLPESLKFVFCSMNSASPSGNESLEQCSKESGISWEILKNCYESGEGGNLLANNGQRSKPVIGLTNFVPTVLFNGQFDQALQNESLTNLKGVLCKVLNVCGK